MVTKAPPSTPRRGSGRVCEPILPDALAAVVTRPRKELRGRTRTVAAVLLAQPRLNRHRAPPNDGMPPHRRRRGGMWGYGVHRSVERAGLERAAGQDRRIRLARTGRRTP